MVIKFKQTWVRTPCTGPYLVFTWQNISERIIMERYVAHDGGTCRREEWWPGMRRRERRGGKTHPWSPFRGPSTPLRGPLLASHHIAYFSTITVLTPSFTFRPCMDSSHKSYKCHLELLHNPTILVSGQCHPSPSAHFKFQSTAHSHISALKRICK